jgi:hypothetical protein
MYLKVQEVEKNPQFNVIVIFVLLYCGWAHSKLLKLPFDSLWDLLNRDGRRGGAPALEAVALG